MYISRIVVQNVRCFEEIELEFDLRGNSPPWAMIVGDNATGKTTLLRCIAIGLCDESSAASLMKESEEGYNRRGGSSNAKILITLIDPQTPEESYEISTTIEKIPVKGARKDYIERVRQKIVPKRDFPWEKIFACAYGAGRGTSGTGDIAGYSVINSVYNMFNYSEGLQNPELIIRRIKRFFSEKEVFEILKTLLVKTTDFELSESGLSIGGPWGSEMPLRDLADGYKSTFLWVTDLIGWALSHEPKIKSSSEISGVVLIDEIEQHLHPKWQREIVYLLKRQFPKTQFITTTHSPLVASSVRQITSGTQRDKLCHLSLQDNNTVSMNEIKESMKGYRADQVLASEAFDYLIDADPEVEDFLREATKLASKGAKRTADEEKRYQEIKRSLKKILIPDGQTLPERIVQEEYYRKMKAEIRELEKKLFKDDQ